MTVLQVQATQADGSPLSSLPERSRHDVKCKVTWHTVSGRTNPETELAAKPVPASGLVTFTVDGLADTRSASIIVSPI